MALKVFLDTNILTDHIQNRNSFSIEVIKLCELGKIQGYVSSASFYTLVFLVKKYSTLSPRSVLDYYLEMVEPLPTSKENLFGSLASSFTDLEDAFQYYTALNERGMDYFVTNNVKDFKYANPSLPVLSAQGFIKVINAK
jgi:hypothetical protein